MGLSAGPKAALPAGYIREAPSPVAVPHGSPSFVEDQAVEIVSEIGERDLRLGTRDADGAYEHPHLVLLTSEDMFDASTHGGPGGVGARGARRHLLAFGLPAMDAADPAARLQPSLVGSAAIRRVRPDVGGGVVAGHHIVPYRRRRQSRLRQRRSARRRGRRPRGCARPDPGPPSRQRGFPTWWYNPSGSVTDIFCANTKSACQSSIALPTPVLSPRVRAGPLRRKVGLAAALSRIRNVPLSSAVAR